MTTTVRVLLVDDSVDLRMLLRLKLESWAEYEVVAEAGDGEAGVQLAEEHQPDLVMLDWMLPKVSGIEICRRLRSRPETRNLPVIMLTARGEESDRIRGLDTGADDYLVKPFSMTELVARIRAVLRRGGENAEDLLPSMLEGGPVRMDVERHTVLVDGASVAMPLKEFELLESFLRSPGRLLTRERLIQRIWGGDYVGDTKTLDVHVKRLRQKIERDPHEPEHLVTVRGLGYKFVD